MRDNEIQLLLSVWKNAGGKRERKRCGCKCCKSRKCCSQCCRSYRGIYEKSGSHLVCCSSEGRWNAQIQHQGKKYYLGSYQTREEAALEYDRAALKFHGENAVCNFNGTSKSQPQGAESQPPPPAASSVDVANILMSLRAIDTSSLPRPELRHYNTRVAQPVYPERAVYNPPPHKRLKKAELPTPNRVPVTLAVPRVVLDPQEWKEGVSANREGVSHEPKLLSPASLPSPLYSSLCLFPVRTRHRPYS